MTEDQIRQTALELYGQNDDVQVHEDAPINETDSGYWVAAWVYIPKESSNA